MHATVLWLISAALVIAAFPTGASERLFRFGDAGSCPPLFEAAPPDAGYEARTLSLAYHPSDQPRFSRFDAITSGGSLFPRQMAQLSARSPVRGRAFSLLNRRLPSRYSSGAWAGLHAGFGDVLWEDKVGRAQKNGAGIQDPYALYLKFNLKF